MEHSKKPKTNLINGKSNFYKNIYNVALNKPFTRKHISDSEKRLYNAYSNILISHFCNETSSFLKNEFQNKISSGAKDLLKLKNQITIPNNIVNQFPLIKVKYQNEIWNSDKLISLDEPNYENCYKALEYFYDIYNWSEEESGGRNPMVSKDNKNILKHYASLMADWMNSKSINEIIAQNIYNYIGKTIDVGFDINGKLFETFNKNNKSHINIVINKTISEIDTVVRFTLKNYFENYFCILENKQNEQTQCENWALYMEHGTKNKRLIEFQKLGIPRHLSKLFETSFSEYYKFDDNDILIEINFISIKEQILTLLEEKEYKELYDVLEENNLI